MHPISCSTSVPTVYLHTELPGRYRLTSGIIRKYSLLFVSYILRWKGHILTMKDAKKKKKNQLTSTTKTTEKHNPHFFSSKLHSIGNFHSWSFSFFITIQLSSQSGLLGILQSVPNFSFSSSFSHQSWNRWVVYPNNAVMMLLSYKHTLLYKKF